MKGNLAALLLTLAVAARASAQARSEFAVAEVRADGLLLPVAKWTGTRWHGLTMTDPDSIRRATESPPLAPGREWYYVPFSGTRARLILGDAVQILTSYYNADDWGFTTNLAVRPFDSPTDRERRVGVATSDSVPLRLFTSAGPREAAFARAAMRRLLDSLWKAVSDSTRKAGERTTWPAPPAADSFTFSASVVRLSDDRTLMYADARLPVSAAADVPTCGIFAGYSGFAILRGERVEFQRGERVLFQNSPVMSDCEGKGHQGESPHALFELGGRTFVFAEHYYYEGIGSFIWEWRDSRLALVFPREP